MGSTRRWRRGQMVRARNPDQRLAGASNTRLAAHICMGTLLVSRITWRVWLRPVAAFASLNMASLLRLLLGKSIDGNQSKRRLTIERDQAAFEIAQVAVIGRHRHPAHGGFLENSAGHLQRISGLGVTLGNSHRPFDPEIVA